MVGGGHGGHRGDHFLPPVLRDAEPRGEDADGDAAGDPGHHVHTGAARQFGAGPLERLPAQPYGVEGAEHPRHTRAAAAVLGSVAEPAHRSPQPGHSHSRSRGGGGGHQKARIGEHGTHVRVPDEPPFRYGGRIYCHRWPGAVGAAPFPLSVVLVASPAG
ncbi:hypothetical protein GCM10027612_49240 [Microbispora bryophytorum subsp. camponoti]